MKIERYILTRPVLITGHDVFGRKSSIQFAPFADSSCRGWYWNVPVTTGAPIIVPIGWQFLSNGLHNLSLEYEKHYLRVLEHIMPIRLCGIDNVLISSQSKNTWPPYLTPQEMLNAFTGAIQKVDDSFIERMHLPVQSIVYEKQVRSGLPCSTTFEPIADSDSIEIDVYVNYENSPFHAVLTVTPELLKEIFSIGAQGWPRWRYFLSRLIRWKHHDRVVWPQDHTKEKTAELFAKHRILDILGALCLIDSKRIPGGIKVTSILSGHALDLKLIQKVMRSKSA